MNELVSSNSLSFGRCRNPGTTFTTKSVYKSTDLPGSPCCSTQPPYRPSRQTWPASDKHHRYNRQPLTPVLFAVEAAVAVAAAAEAVCILRVPDG